ncbi:MAG: hypothetical protein ACJ8M4_01305 [Chthoniobacterales bacterium]
MKRIFHDKLLPFALAIVLLLSLSSCRQQRVILTPGENDLVVLNGCVISACNYLAVMKTQNSLDKNFWAKILLVRFANHPAGHAYCVWETEGNIYGYDRNSGSFPIPVYTRDPRSIAIVLAQELSRIMGEPMAVSQAEFINASEAELFRYASIEQAAVTTPMAVFIEAPSLVKP